jgi:hypothetical protein
MFSYRSRLTILILVGLALALPACSGEPRRIAEYPAGNRPGSQGSTGPGSAWRALAYSAYLELEVTNVESAAKRAEQLAYDYGGYTTDSHFWQQDGKTYATLVLEVPTRQFDRLRERLLRLGSLEDESTTGEWVDPDTLDWDPYSQIILFLKPRDFTWPRLELPQWRPLQTLERAFGVSLAIFGFLVDVLIWVIVIGGPFLLLGWGLKRLVLRLRR